MPKTPTTNVFISYASSDRSRLKKVIGELKQRRVLDEGDKIIDNSNVVAGSEIRNQLREMIEDAAKVIIIWSGSSAASGWVNYEAGMAHALGKPTFFVVPKGERSQLPITVIQNQVIEIDG